MKILKNIIVCLSIVTIVTVVIFSTRPIKVYAEVPDSQKAVGHASTWGSYDFNYSFHRKYWTIQDATGIPTSPTSGPYYFYTSDGVSFFAVNGFDLIQLVITRGVGIIYKENKADAIIQAFFNSITRNDTVNQLYRQGGLYDSNDNYLGYCLNDISGCYYEGNGNATNVTVPSETVNNVYNFIQYYQAEDTSNIPDFITVNTPASGFLFNNLSAQQGDLTTVKSNLETLLSVNQNILELRLVPNSNNTGVQQMYVTNTAAKLNNFYCIQNSSSSYWNNFCKEYELTIEDNELLFGEFYQHMNVGSQKYIKYTIYDNGTNSAKQYLSSYPLDTVDFNGSQSTNVSQGVYLGKYSSSYYVGPFLGENYTIYKDRDTFEGINVDKDYEPPSYNSTIYNNYNVNNNNSFTATIEQITNSTTVNGDIYEDCTQNFYENTENNNIDQTTITENTTVIININYPGGNPGPGPGPDPGGDDNGGGSGGSSDDDDDDDSGVLAEILRAILRFFNAIGDILGTILAGLLNMIDAVLEAVAGIIDSMSGVVDLFTALFAWIPEPVPQVLGLGLSICILAAVISFIRG